jgi:ABC-type phosphate/phosphonate transport system substrate-binding protein
MRASLPMYDLPELRAATDGFWAAIAKQLGVSIRLARNVDWTDAWRQPDLLFSQTCGYPLTHEFKGKLRYVATPHYNADGCEGPNYCSIILARETRPLQDFRGLRAAFNSRDSMSGMLALKAVVVDFASQGQFFSQALETGSHLASLSAVQAGSADICAVDCVTVALLKRHRPSAVAGLVEIGRSPSMPALPYVTRMADVSALQDALYEAMADKNQEHLRSTLLLSGISILDAQVYNAIPRLEGRVIARGDVDLWSP